MPLQYRLARRYSERSRGICTSRSVRPLHDAPRSGEAEPRVDRAAPLRRPEKRDVHIIRIAPRESGREQLSTHTAPAQFLGDKEIREISVEARKSVGVRQLLHSLNPTRIRQSRRHWPPPSTANGSSPSSAKPSSSSCARGNPNDSHAFRAPLIAAPSAVPRALVRQIRWQL